MAKQRSNMYQRLSSVKGCRPFTLGCGTFILLLVGLFIGFAIFSASTTLNINTDWSIKNHQTIRMPVGPGIQESIHIGVGESIQGNWATSGLGISLPGNDLGVVGAKDVNWSDQITVKCASGNGLCPSGGPMILDGSFTVPDLPGPANQTVTGHITGTVYWPHDLGNGTYDTKQTDVDVTVQLVFGTLSTYATFMRSTTVIGYAALVSLIIATIVSVYFAIRFGRYLKRYPKPVNLTALSSSIAPGTDLPLQGPLTKEAQRHMIWEIQQGWKRSSIDGLYAAHKWNRWRLASPGTPVDLHGDNLSLGKDSNLEGINLSGANLSSANLREVSLKGANLSGADLSGADLSGANLSGADLRYAKLANANLSGTNLSGVDLSSIDRSAVNLNEAIISEKGEV